MNLKKLITGIAAEEASKKIFPMEEPGRVGKKKIAVSIAALAAVLAFIAEKMGALGM